MKWGQLSGRKIESGTQSVRRYDGYGDFSAYDVATNGYGAEVYENRRLGGKRYRPSSSGRYGYSRSFDYRPSRGYLRGCF